MKALPLTLSFGRFKAGGAGSSRYTLVSGFQRVSSGEGFLQVLLAVPRSRQPQAKLRKEPGLKEP